MKLWGCMQGFHKIIFSRRAKCFVLNFFTRKVSSRWCNQWAKPFSQSVNLHGFKTFCVWFIWKNILWGEQHNTTTSFPVVIMLPCPTAAILGHHRGLLYLSTTSQNHLKWLKVTKINQSNSTIKSWKHKNIHNYS